MLTSLVDGVIIAIIQNQLYVYSSSILIVIGTFIITPIIYLSFNKISNNYSNTALVSIVISTIGFILYNVNAYFILLSFTGIAISKILFWGLGLKVNSLYRKTPLLVLITLSVYSVSVFAGYLLTDKLYHNNIPAIIIVLTISMVVALALLPYFMRNVVDKIEKKEENMQHSILMLSQLEQLCYDFKLTKREFDVLKLIIQDLKYQEVADKLYISINTVRSHMKNIYNKIEVNNKASLVVKINHQLSK